MPGPPQCFTDGYRHSLLNLCSDLFCGYWWPVHSSYIRTRERGFNLTLCLLSVICRHNSGSSLVSGAFFYVWTIHWSALNGLKKTRLLLKGTRTGLKKQTMSKDGQWPVSFRNPGKLLLKNYRNAWLLGSKILRNRWCLKTFAQYCKPCPDETVPWAWKQFRSLGMLCQQNGRKLLYFPVHSGEEECVNILRLASLMSNSWQKTQKSKNGIRNLTVRFFYVLSVPAIFQMHGGQTMKLCSV